MFSGSRAGRAAIDHAIGALPNGWRWLLHGPDRLVIGPTGAFAIADDLPTIEQAAERVARAAVEVRDFLASALSWAPFVDALVVVDGGVPAANRATIVPTRLLTDVLTSGPQMLDEDDVDRIADQLQGLDPPRPATAIR
jgi:hypothetical protein